VGLLLTFITGLVIWVVLWAIGVKSFDAFMLTVGLVFIAAAGRLIAPFLPGHRTRD
jgi:hypothetical protein